VSSNLFEQDRRVIARKRHDCVACDGIISPGRPYVRVFIVDRDHKASSIALHPTCFNPEDRPDDAE
jgi:hypothetical protein